MTESKVSDIFSSLINEIRKLEKTRKLSIEEDELLNNAIQWLKDHQHPDGYWGYESVADTGLVLLALSTYGVKEKEWSVRGKYKGGIQKSVDWLKSTLDVNNWRNNLWDTSICLQALLKQGIGEDWVFRIAEWVRNECREKPEKYAIHHLAQAINTLLEAGFEEDAKNVSEILAVRIKEVVNKEEALFDLYVCGQALDALTRSKFDLTSEVVRRIDTGLRKSLERISTEGLSEAGFQDVTMAFLGLASFLGGEDTPLINSVITELFKMPERYKEDGSWYHDAKKTAFALVGISRVKDIRKVNEFPNRIYKLILHHQRKAKKLYRNLELKGEKKASVIRRGYLWLSLTYCSILASLIIAITLGVNTFLPQLIITLLVTASLSAVVKAYLSFKGRVKE